MPDRFTGFLDAYDLFGKAIPGVAWFFGLVLVAPTTLKVGLSGTTVELQSLAVLVVISALVGVVFGQGIDILARLFEQLLAWIRRQVRRLARIVLVILGKVSIGIRSRVRPRLEDAIEDHPKGFSILITWVALFSIIAIVLAVIARGTSLLVFATAFVSSVFLSIQIPIQSTRNETRRDDDGGRPDGFLEEVEILEDFDHPDPSAVLANTYRWMLSRLNAMNTTMTSHRSLFAAYLDSRADAYVEPIDPDNIAYSRFEAVVEPFLEVNLEDFGQNDNQYSFVDLYPFITSHLRSNGFTRAKGFQARYSFCRSMWLTTSIFATVLLGLHLHVSGSPSLGNLSDTEPTPIVSIVLMILWFLLLAVFIGLFFEFATRSMNRYSPTLVWITGLGYAALALSLDSLREWLVIQGHRILLDVLAVLVTIVVVFSKAAASVSSFLLGYEGFDQVVAVQIFDDSLIGLAVLLLVSAVAFFDATGSYKRNYVEYLIAEASIGLPDEKGELSDNGSNLAETNSNGNGSQRDDAGPESGGRTNSDGGDTSENNDQEVSEEVDVDNVLQTLGQRSGTTSSTESTEESKQEEDPDEN